MSFQPYPQASTWQRYKTWVKENANFISAIEGSLYYLTWLLPDRFNESELSLEGFNSVLGLLALWHESILAEGQSAPDAGAGPLPLPLLLRAIHQVEVLIEMGARTLERQGKANTYTPLTALEVTKAAIRLLILRKAKGRLLTNGGLDQAHTAHFATAQTNPHAKAQEVVVAFTRFRERHCEPRETYQQEQGKPDGLSKSREDAKQLEAAAAANSMLSDTKQAVHAEAGGSPPSTGEEQPSDKPKSYAAAVAESISDVEPSSTTESNEESTASASGRTGSTEVEVLEAHALGSSVMSGTSSYWWDSPVSSQLSSPGDGITAELSGSGLVPQQIEQHPPDKINSVGALLENQNWSNVGMQVLRSGELAHILRPVVYVIALRRYGRRSWKPWLFSLAVELASSQCTAAGVRLAQSPQSTTADPGYALLSALRTFRLTPPEQNEVTRRKLLFLFYLIRSPFFDVYTKGGVITAQRWLDYIPLLGSLTNKACEILFGVQQYYAYTAGS